MFHLGAGAEDGEEVVAVPCSRGELSSVPAGVKHWFDCGEPSLRAIRLFTSPNGWVPQYTGSEIGLKHSW